MKKIFAFVLIIIFSTEFIYAQIIECDTKPNSKFKKIGSLILYPFDGKLINSGNVELLDFIKISDNLHKYFLEKFQDLKDFNIINGKEIISTTSEDHLSYQRGIKVPEYDEKGLNSIEETSLDSIKSAEASLYGKITKFYPDKEFEKSYIEIIFYLVDTFSKEILWTGKISGCLKFVVDTIIKTIASGEYTEPTVKDIKDFKWENPYEKRFRRVAIMYRLGYFITFSDKIENGLSHIFGLYFKLPVFYKNEIYNSISLNVIPSLNSLDRENWLSSYEYTTCLPIFFNFIYNFDKILKIRLQNLIIFGESGLGISFIRKYYAGSGKQIDGRNLLTGALNLGIGAEYFLEPGMLNFYKFYFKIKRLGIITAVNYYKLFISLPANNAINLSVGLKYYF